MKTKWAEKKLAAEEVKKAAEGAAHKDGVSLAHRGSGRWRRLSGIPLILSFITNKTRTRVPYPVPTSTASEEGTRTTTVEGRGCLFVVFVIV